MKIYESINYAIISTNISKEILKDFSEYEIITEDAYNETLNIINLKIPKRIVYFDCLRDLSEKEKKDTLELLQKGNINFINITSDMEELLLSDFLYVLDNNKIVLDGETKEVLREEKVLKRLGFSLPFVVNLSIQLGYYNLIDEVYYSEESLVDALWN